MESFRNDVATQLAGCLKLAPCWPLDGGDNIVIVFFGHDLIMVPFSLAQELHDG